MPQTADVLAELYFDAGEARLLLTGIGFPPSRIPAFSTPAVFWSRVVQEIENGLLADGTKKLVEGALQTYSHNERLKALAEDLGVAVPASPAPAPTPSSRGLSSDWIMRIYQAGIGANLPSQRAALVAVLPPDVRGALSADGSAPAAATLMADLGALNNMAAQGNPSPFEQWLVMAGALASALPDAASALAAAASELRSLRS